jgi:hypothetical protein
MGYLGGYACINDCFTAPCGCDPESNTVTPHCDESGAVTWPALFASRAIAEEAAADYAMVYQEIRRRDDQNQRLFPCGPGAFFCMSSSDTFWFRFRTHL